MQLGRHYWLLPPMLLAMAASLRGLGRPLVCDCSLALWASISSPGSSQQIADVYSIVHVVHGVMVFGLLWMARRVLSAPLRVVGAVAIAIGWELIENSAITIEYFRERTISSSYTGDSILNSSTDVCFCVIGYGLASRLPGKMSVAAAVLTELTLTLWVRDSMTLNVIMLLYPLEAIRRWQLGQ